MSAETTDGTDAPGGADPLGFLLRLSDRLRSLADPEEIALRAAEMLGQHLEAPRAGYGEIDAAGEIVTVRRDWTDGSMGSLAGEARILDAFGPDVVAELRAGRTLIVQDCLTDARAGEAYAATWASIGTRSLVVEPLVKGGRLRALFYLHEPRPRAWTADEARLAREVAERTWDAVERARAEAALRESEARLRLFSDASRDGVMVHDGRTVVDANEAFVRMYGYTDVRDLVGRDILVTLAPESRPVIRSKIEHRAEALTEVVAQRKDGSTFPAEVWAREAAWQGQRVRIVLARDLTATKRHEAELRERKSHLDAIFDQAAAGIVEVDLSGRFLRVNDRYCEIVGRTREDLLGHLRMQEITHPDDLPGNLILFRRMAETGEPFEIEKRYVRQDGGIVWVNNSVTLVNDHTGRPLSVVAVTVDVTDRRQAEADLRESEERHRALFEQAAVGVAHLDRNGRWIAANQKLCDILGYTHAELMERSFRSITHPDDLKDDLPLVRAIDAGDIPSFRREKRYVRKDGSALWVEVNVSAVRDPSGRPAYRLAIVQDVQERKRWEEHQRLLINELNHRVKNTLATVQSIAAQTLRNAPSAHDARDALESRLLALSRAHDVLTRENWEGADLHDIVAQAVAPYSSRGEDRLHLRGPRIRLPPRMALALAMALQELATNAVKYGALSNATGEVEIGWDLRDGEGESRLRLAWAERGGPPVRAPSRRGFGTRLIERSLAQDLGGEVRVSFEPEGLTCEVDAPLPAA